MFTWTSETPGRACRIAGLVLVAALISGCIAGGQANPPRQIIVSQDRITLTGPEGFCVDRSERRDDADGAFVLLASCASISGSTRQPHPRVPALLTVTVTPPVEGAEPAAPLTPGDLRRFFATDAGHAALSRGGNAASVDVLDTAASGDVFYIYLRDASIEPVSAMRGLYWRAVFEIEGHLLSVSVFSTANRPFSSATGEALLRRFVAQIQADNG